MPSYADITRQIGDQWVAALKKAEDTVATVTNGAQDRLSKIDLPQVPVPGQVSRLGESVVDRLPRPSEILEANFELTERLLAAHKALALKVMAASTEDTATEDAATEEPAAATKSAAPKPAPKKTSQSSVVRSVSND